MRIFVLLFFLHQPPDEHQLFRFYFSTSQGCEEKGQRILKAWEHLDEDAEVSFQCIDIKELGLV